MTRLRAGQFWVRFQTGTRKYFSETSIPALGLTKFSVELVGEGGYFPWAWSWSLIHLMPILKASVSTPPLLLHAFMACTEITFTYSWHFWRHNPCGTSASLTFYTLPLCLLFYAIFHFHLFQNFLNSHVRLSLGLPLFVFPLLSSLPSLFLFFRCGPAIQVLCALQ